MLNELRALAVLAKVVEVGSFRGAARALSLAPSVVSHHVSELETRLGVPLIYRSTRKLSLTPAGARLASDARGMVEAAERGLDGVRAGGARPRGTLRVTLPAFLADSSVCGDLTEFSRAHPEVQIVASFNDAPHDLLRDGFDVALRIGTLENSGHRTRRLGVMHRVLVGVSAFRSTPSDAERLPFVHLASRPATIALTRKGQEIAFRFVPTFSVDSAAAIRALLVAGAGVGTLPEVMVRDDLASGRLTEVLSGWRVQPVAVHAVWPSSPVRATLTHRFVEFLAPRLARLFRPGAPHTGVASGGRDAPTGKFRLSGPDGKT
jgi:DNA-binding transcriptional LysR family regulator